MDKKGYIEDRRPNANMDPYLVTKLIVETVCGTADGDLKVQEREPAVTAV
jgi:glutamine synthetase